MNIALIVGCARSGTSILGELIAAHPQVKYFFEAHAVWETAGMGPDESHRLTAEHATPEVCATIRRWFEEQRGNGLGFLARLRRSWPMLVEKCPRNVLRIPFLRRVFPEAKLIHIIRDGRDVACSLVPGAGMKEWDHLRPPGWKELRDSYQGACRCALAWKTILEIALEDLESVPHLEVRYEELVQRPVVVARRLMDYLGLSLHPAVKDFCGRISNQTENSYHSSHQVHWYVDDHKTRIGRWRENLNDQEQQFVQDQLGPLLKRLGYEAEPRSLAS